jgi:hypothetical protein
VPPAAPSGLVAVAGSETSVVLTWKDNSGNEAPRPEAEVSGRPPRGGRFREVAPVGGVDVNRTGASPDRSAEATPNSSPKAVAKRNTRRRHAGSLEALRVTRPEAVVS